MPVTIDPCDNAADDSAETAFAFCLINGPMP